ncbi:MAG: cyclophilin-like fold protein [Eubacterium sp.]|nr:cyclophilin-like fold protein [Eubacterium sp.]
MKNNAAGKIIAAAAGILLLSGCQSRADESGLPNTPYIESKESSVSEQGTSTTSETEPTENTEDIIMETNEIYIKIGENTLTAVLEDNESAAALKELISDKTLTISASNYGGFEKVCALGTSLPRNDVQTAAGAGDICLYSGNQIVIFYGSNSWSYTRLGKISDANGSELEKILGGSETEITLSLKPLAMIPCS